MNTIHPAHHPHTEKMGFLNILVLFLSIYVLFALMVDTFFKLPHEVSHLLTIIDDLICIVFLYDFILRFSKSKNKVKFMHWGWIDLLSSIPALHILRVGRALRLVRLLRILRAFRSTRHIIHHIFRRKTEGALTIAAIIAVLMVLFSSIAILQVETDPDSNIKTAEDAIWWAYVTITTVGYGDKYPVTTEGRLIAALLMSVGIALFGIFTAYLAAWFVEQTKKEDSKEEK